MSIYHNFRHQVNTLGCFALLLMSTIDVSAADKTPVLDVTDISAWEHKSFSGDTLYSTSRMGDRACIKAESRQSASGLFKDIKIDLHKTPIIHWDWFVPNTLGDINETQKDGDDYAARIYVVISGGVFFWKTRALNYVWASQKLKHSSWPNAFTDNATMVAVESGTKNSGRWVHESRNVLDDVKKFLKLDSQYIDAVAIMTDTDNSARQAVACYGEIYFSSP